MTRKSGLLVAFIAGFLFLPAVAFAQDGGVSPEAPRKVAPRLGAAATQPAPRLPVPVVPPVEALAVRIVGLPVDETGHLIINDHPHGSRPVEVTNLPQSQVFAGFTAVETLPNIGVFGMTRLCAAEIPGSRMCTLQEALNTSDPPVLAAYVPAGWVRDEAISRQPVPTKSPIEPVPDPGLQPTPTAQNNQCLGWGSTEGWATTLTSDGSIGVRSCSESAPVACCRPKI